MVKMNRVGKALTTGLLTLALLVAVTAVSQPTVEAQSPPDGQSQQDVTVDPGPGTEYIDPELWALLHRQASGEGNLPSPLDIGLIYYIDDDGAISAAISAAGGLLKSESVWQIPTDQVLSIIQRPDVHGAVIVSADASGTASSQMNDTLADVVSAYRAGVPAKQAALYAFFIRGGSVTVLIDVPDSDTETEVRRWLSANTTYAPPLDPGNGIPLRVAALLPVEQIEPLSQTFPTVSLTAENYQGQGLPMTRSRWPQSALDYENWIVDVLLHGPPPDSSGASGVVDERPIGGLGGWEVDLVARRKAHGVDAWHRKGLDGSGVKVGIIDWGFRGINDDLDLPDLVIVGDKENPNWNALCQPVHMSTWPHGSLIQLVSDPCEPLFGALGRGVDMDHGVNVAELVQDMAPGAELYFAQANSPRQLYEAADWLNDQNVDVIVHAGGWPYDGPGDGTSPFTVSVYENSPTTGGNEHSPYRYYPSPLNTVDEFVKDSSGPVWINAAGNAERLTLFVTSPQLLGGKSKYSDFLILNSAGSNDSDRTCQPVPKDEVKIYIYSLRWADTWPSGDKDLDFIVLDRWANPNPSLWDRLLGWRDLSFARSDRTEQFPSAHPVRRVAKMSYASLLPVDMCLRIRVNADSSGQRVAPGWVQFQILTNDTDASIGQSGDVSGYSVVNPASSSNPGLLAIGAMDLRYAARLKLMEYSSQGPVRSEQGSWTPGDWQRIKPDIVAGSGAATHTKWDDCGQSLSACDEKLYFGGTSAATGHTGGLAALVVQWLKRLGVSYTPADIANYLRDSGRPQDNPPDPNNSWGHGLIRLPCPSEKLPSITHSGSYMWSARDCESIRRPGMYADYYTFTLPSRTGVQIDLKSSTANPYIYLFEGLFTGDASFIATDDDGGVGNNARITMALDAGTYTIVATTDSRVTTGSYQLEITSATAFP